MTFLDVLGENLKALVMLPHFPKSNKEMTEIRNNEMFNGIYSVSPILSQIGTRPQREGQNSSFQDEDGAIRQIDYKKRSVGVTRKLKEARGMTLLEFVETAQEPGIGMGREMLRSLYEAVDRTTQETGNIITGPVTGETVLKMLEKIQFDFDQEGNPIWPSLHLGSDAYKQFKENLPRWLDDAAFVERLKSIVEKQKEKFYEREACRRLAD